jgi:hypothetical protein
MVSSHPSRDSCSRREPCPIEPGRAEHRHRCEPSAVQQRDSGSACLIKTLVVQQLPPTRSSTVDSCIGTSDRALCVIEAQNFADSTDWARHALLQTGYRYQHRTATSTNRLSSDTFTAMSRLHVPPPVDP